MYIFVNLQNLMLLLNNDIYYITLWVKHLKKLFFKMLVSISRKNLIKFFILTTFVAAIFYPQLVVDWLGRPDFPAPPLSRWSRYLPQKAELYSVVEQWRFISKLSKERNKFNLSQKDKKIQYKIEKLISSSLSC